MSLDVDRIGAVVTAAKGEGDELMAIVNGLTPLATQSSGSKVIFDHEDLQIRIGMRGQFAQMLARLKELGPLKLTVAPMVAAMFSTDESDVVVSRRATPRVRPKDAARPPSAAAISRRVAEARGRRLHARLRGGRCTGASGARPGR